MYPIIKAMLFQLSPEKAHHISMKALVWSQKIPGFKHLIKKNFTIENDQLHTTLWNLNFKNPVGLAAGFDKDAQYIDQLAQLGFSHIEIGTLTPKPQPGNPAPRLYRLIQDKALINRMGFNNQGVEAAVKRLKDRKSNIIIGGNIGKNKNTPNEKAIDDYAYCFRKLYDYVDYFVVNVSSPNTPNLRELQEKEPLTHILKHLQTINASLGKNRPVLLKIAPDLSTSQLDDIIEIVQETHLAGIVATNTTIQRKGLASTRSLVAETGGLSGKPVTEKSTEVIRYIHQKSNGNIQIIGVGGIFDGKDAQDKLEAGASLIQVYTGFIYQGPSIVKQICTYLLKKK